MATTTLPPITHNTPPAATSSTSQMASSSSGAAPLPPLSGGSVNLTGISPAQLQRLTQTPQTIGSIDSPPIMPLFTYKNPTTTAAAPEEREYTAAGYIPGDTNAPTRSPKHVTPKHATLSPGPTSSSGGPAAAQSNAHPLYQATSSPGQSQQQYMASDQANQLSMTRAKEELSHHMPGGDGRGTSATYLQEGMVAGKYVWDNGDVYEGQFVNGLMHGRGTYWYASTGNRYEGDWVNGKKEGMGKFVNQTRQDVYEGMFRDGARCGEGVCVNVAQGARYVGTWVNNAPHGRGVMTDRLGVYEGHFVRGKKQGVGRMTYADGSVYNGEWLQDLYHGKGTFTCPSFTYTGEWRQGEMHGKGQCRLPNGTVRVGFWMKGRREGVGEEYLPDGSRYKGNFRNDMRNGEGTFIYPTGDHCFGNWKDNVLEGPGVYTSNGKTSMVVYTNGKCSIII